MNQETHRPRSKAVSFERVDPRILTLFPELVRGLGGEPEALLRRVGCDVGWSNLRSIEISYRQMINLVAFAADELECLDFGMRLGHLQADAITTPLRDVVRNSLTLGEALNHVVKLSYAHSLAAAIWLRRSPSEQTVTVGHDILLENLPDRRQAIEQILLVEYLICVEETGGLARARHVEFRHQPISSPAIYRSHFGCDARFGQASDAIVYYESALTCPILSPDSMVCRSLIADIDAAFAEHTPPLHATVRRVIMHLLASSQCTNVEVASQFGLHTRRLHRGLTREGTTFQKIKNQVRRDFLVYLLDKTDLPIAQISERLGFAEQSAMTRFCKQSLAVSPTERRASARHPR
ncbi:AraC-like DNA-binding protein [Novosphingobium sp. PhB165]|uniref:AraC family transcriptional regulator n=1 Tax=Novosphingobium sp. PhB165 TaxID=2485105 RepID=UPI0010EA2F90|nr:AraC family transcriptional regulator [Novosphingobium sp. PhB165]TCM13038.1 AraC-like DNA-binding protein [Novosphingobium sp. PhB165]